MVVFFAYCGIVLFANPNVGYPAVTATLLLLVCAIAVGKWAARFQHGFLTLASSAVGLAGLLRWDFGVFGLLALGLTVAAVKVRSDVSEPRRFVVMLSGFGPALAIGAAVYLPLLAVSPIPTRRYQEILPYVLFELPKWRGVEFVRPTYWEFVQALQYGSPGLLYRSVLKLAYLVLPAILATIILGLVVHNIVRGNRNVEDT